VDNQHYSMRISIHTAKLLLTYNMAGIKPCQERGTIMAIERHIMVSVLEGSACNVDSILQANLQHTNRIVRTGILIVAYYGTDKAMNKDIKIMKEIEFDHDNVLTVFRNNTNDLLFVYAKGTKIAEKSMVSMIISCYKLLFFARDAGLQTFHDDLVRQRYNDIRSESRRKLRAVA